MSLKIMIDNDYGFIHTLEAVLGTILIIGTVIFMTDIIPYTAQKTGEHSKIQLVNTGRDVLDLIELTPITDIFNNYSKSQGVNRTYTLVANRTFVQPGESINFTVYYLDTDEIVKETLTLEKNDLGFDQKVNMTTITGSRIWSFPLIGEYEIRAVDSITKTTKYSNSVIIVVGYYFLHTDANGIFENGNKNVSGIVYDVNNVGVPNLTIRILKDDGTTVLYSSVTNTSRMRIIENFENLNGWTNSSGSKIVSNTTMVTEGSSSISVNGISNFWIKRTNITSYKLLDYDNIYFDIFSTAITTKVGIELSKNNTPDKLIWRNIPITNIGWNRISIQLKYPDITIGNVTIKDIDTINISLSNIGVGNYFFDNLTADAGSFFFVWPGTSAGIYFIQAIDKLGRISNKHEIIYSGSNPDDIGILCCDSVIYETESINITLYPSGNNKNIDPISNFNINQIFYQQYDKSRITISNPINPEKTIVTLTAYSAGYYYIFYGNAGQGKGQPAKAPKTNGILIRVLPLQDSCIFSDCRPKCSGLKMEDLNLYMRLFMPPNINYNLYLINPDGTLCVDCPEFKEIINSYPTKEAVTVNKIFHIKTLSKEYFRELRMTLWYK